METRSQTRRRIEQELKERQRKRDEDRAILVEWIIDQYTRCSAFKDKVDWEGVEYFYESYTTVPADYFLYETMVDSITSGLCVCNHKDCENYEPCSDDDDDDEEEEEKDEEKGVLPHLCPHCSAPKAKDSLVCWFCYSMYLPVQ